METLVKLVEIHNLKPPASGWKSVVIRTKINVLRFHSYEENNRNDLSPCHILDNCADCRSSDVPCSKSSLTFGNFEVMSTSSSKEQISTTELNTERIETSSHDYISDSKEQDSSEGSSYEGM